MSETIDRAEQVIKDATRDMLDAVRGIPTFREQTAARMFAAMVANEGTNYDSDDFIEAEENLVDARHAVSLADALIAALAEAPDEA